jgi:hypothetical protein
MTAQKLFLLILLYSACAFSVETETFDRIVLKDMTVIKAGLVKEVGDSLAYFELNDPDFVKHVIAKDQVFKWVKAAAQPVPPATVQANSIPPAPAPAAPAQAIPIAKDTTADNLPVVDYQVVLARLDSIERSKQQPATVAVPIKTDSVAHATPPAVAEYDSGNAVPDGLTQVRLDPPTGTDVKVVPRSGLVAININPSFTSLGLGFRTWSAGGFGFATGGSVMWGSASGFKVQAQLMLATNAKSKNRVRWYVFPLIGYQWVSISIPSMDLGFGSTPSSTTDLALMNFAFGLGGEWRVGIRRNHGLAVELGYQGGSADYTTHMDAYTVGYGPYSTTIPAQDTKGTWDNSPLYLMFSYAYYF